MRSASVVPSMRMIKASALERASSSPQPNSPAVHESTPPSSIHEALERTFGTELRLSQVLVSAAQAPLRPSTPHAAQLDSFGVDSGRGHLSIARCTPTLHSSEGAFRDRLHSSTLVAMHTAQPQRRLSAWEEAHLIPGPLLIRAHSSSGQSVRLIRVIRGSSPGGPTS